MIHDWLRYFLTVRQKKGHSGDPREEGNKAKDRNTNTKYPWEFGREAR